MFVVGVSAVVFRGRRDQGTGLRIDPATIGRDVGFFLIFLTLRCSGTLRAGGLMLGGLFYVAFVIGAIIAVT
jgi:hypothetical protein